jgi:excisionase family DNA binding protein
MSETFEIKKLYNAREIANFFGVTPTTLYKWVKYNGLKCYNFGRVLRFALKDIEAFLQAHEYVLTESA